MLPRARLQPSPALSALHEADQRAGIDPLAPSPVVTLPASVSPPGPPFIIEPPPWSSRYVPDAGGELEGTVTTPAKPIEMRGTR